MRLVHVRWRTYEHTKQENLHWHAAVTLPDCQQAVKLEEAAGTLAGDFQPIKAGIAGTREFLN